MNIKSAFRSNRACLAMTGLSVIEFEELVPMFSQCLLEERIKRNPYRKRKYGGGRTGGLRTLEEKLFYVLMYLKTYPTFDVASFYLGLDRSNCCRAIQAFLPVLSKTLGRKLTLPKRQIRSVEEFARLFPEIKDVFPDGTERRVQRP